MKKEAKGIKKDECQMCRSKDLYLVLNLGHQPHSDYFLKESELDEMEALFPLRFVSCQNCGLLQIDYFVDPEYLYQGEYLYQSSTTATGRAHYKNMAASIVDKFNFPKGSLAIDVGSNVGVLLQGFKDVGMKVLGVDPAEVARKAIENGIPTIIDFFNVNVAEKIDTEYGKAKIITGTNVFAHLHDIDSAVIGMEKILDYDGVIVIEAPYAVDLIEHIEYDTIYHQHIGYLSVKPMRQYFKRFGLELFDIEKNSIHGGTLRYFVGKIGAHEINSSVTKAVEEENDFGLYNNERLDSFREQVEQQRTDLLDLLLTIKKDGKTVTVLSTPAKGNTLLNYVKIDSHLADFATERNPLKVGRYTPATHIPIFSDEKILEDMPDYALILAWNFADEIIENMTEYREKGGKFIIPIPTPKIV